MNEAKLLKLKLQIDKSKMKVAQLTGQTSYIKSELAKFDCLSINDAKRKLKRLGKQSKKLLATIRKGSLKLEKELEDEKD